MKIWENVFLEQNSVLVLGQITIKTQKYVRTIKNYVRVGELACTIKIDILLLHFEINAAQFSQQR